ncbi:MAG: YggT family protein [Armatimonadota bacterium]
MRSTVLISLQLLYYAVMLLVLAGVILSWLPHLRWRPIGRLIYNLTEPVFQPIRRLIPPIRLNSGVAVDLTPIIVVILVEVVYLALKILISKAIPT